MSHQAFPKAAGTVTDGYVLTYSSADGYYKPIIRQVGRVQNGANYGNFLDILGFANISSTNETATFVNAATWEFNPNDYRAASGTRTITLRVTAETTSPTMTLQLYNYTAAAVVTGTTLTTTSTVPTTLTTGDLTANLTNGSAVYILQIKMAAGGGGSSERVTVDNAAIRIQWT